MKGWIATALAVTFLAGGSTGVLFGRYSVPLPDPPRAERSYIDGFLDQMRAAGVTKKEDLARARRILEERDRKTMALKDKVMLLLEDQLGGIDAEAEREIREILSAYPGAGNQAR
jgi:hypothetical protein